MADITDREAELLRNFNDFPDIDNFKSFAHNIAIHAEEHKGGQTGGKVAGQVDGRHIFDTTFREALAVYSAGITSDLTPQGQPWAELVPQSFKPAKVSIKAYNAASDRIRTRLGQSNFYSGFHESVNSGGMFGTQCLSMVPSKRKLFNFQEIPFGSYRFRETVDGDPDVVFHEWKPMTASQIIKHFRNDPLARIPDFIEERKDDHTNKFTIVHLVQPREGADLDNIEVTADELRRPYESIYFFGGGSEQAATAGSGTIIREGGMYYQPYIVVRVLKSRHDAPWGRSSGTQIYPTTKMINRAMRDIGVGVEKEVRPPILRPNNSSLVMDDRAGGSMYFDQHNQNAKPEPWKVNPNLNYVEWFVGRLEGQIKSAFFNDMFKFFTQQSVATTEKTAFEAQLQAEEQLKLFSPIFTNIATEGLDKVIKNSFTEMYVRGEFSDLDFGDEKFQVAYTSRIAIAVRAQRTTGAIKLAQFAEVVETFAEGAASRVADWEGILSDAAIDSAVSAERINDQDTIDQLKQKDNEIRELSVALEQLQTAATAAQQGGLT